MASVTLKGEETKLKGGFLSEGDLAPDFVLCSNELNSVTLANYQGKRKVIATVPSVDTEVCREESKSINELALKFPDILFFVISKDLPFALDRFCKKAHLSNLIPLSDLRSRSNFAKNYGVQIASGPLDGLLARSILFLDQSDKVLYSELVSEITALPNFQELQQKIEESEG